MCYTERLKYYILNIIYKIYMYFNTVLERGEKAEKGKMKKAQGVSRKLLLEQVCHIGCAES